MGRLRKTPVKEDNVKKPEYLNELAPGLPDKQHYSVAEIAKFLNYSQSAILSAGKTGRISMIQPFGERGEYRIPRAETIRLAEISTISE